MAAPEAKPFVRFPCDDRARRDSIHEVTRKREPRHSLLNDDVCSATARFVLWDEKPGSFGIVASQTGMGSDMSNSARGQQRARPTARVQDGRGEDLLTGRGTKASTSSPSIMTRYETSHLCCKKQKTVVRPAVVVMVRWLSAGTGTLRLSDPDRAARGYGVMRRTGELYVSQWRLCDHM